MEILQDIVQGTPEWHQVRANYFTASEASAMMGQSKYTSRSELLRQKQSGVTPDVDSAKQYLFDRGHATEALARPLAEKRIGEELYPCTATAIVEGLPLLASLDGMTMDETILWEHKLINQDLISMVEQGDLGTYCWQLEQQLLVTGAEKVWFTTSDGTPNNTFGCWYYSDPVKRKQLIAGWKQFTEDLQTFTHTEAAAPVVAHVETLPAVSVRVNGELTVASNLPEFGIALRDFIARIPVKPSTDQDFADCDSACKSLEKAEAALKAAESNAIAQMTDFEVMRRTTSDLHALARSTRLACEKLVKQRKEAVKQEIIDEARTKLVAHIKTLNVRVNGLMPSVDFDFVGAAKNKRNIDSLRDAVDTELARVKIKANEIADLIQLNLETPGLHGYKFLFSDLSLICTKPNEDFVNTVTARISIHEAKEAERIKAETARIAEQERIKAEAKAAADIATFKASSLIASEGVVPTHQSLPTIEWLDIELGSDCVVNINPSDQKPMSGISLMMDHGDRMNRIAKPQRSSTRALVDNILNLLNEDEMTCVLQYLQSNFVKQAA